MPDLLGQVTESDEQAASTPIENQLVESRSQDKQKKFDAETNEQSQQIVWPIADTNEQSQQIVRLIAETYEQSQQIVRPKAETYEQSQTKLIEEMTETIENAETAEAKTELKMGLKEQQILSRTNKTEEMEAMQNYLQEQEDARDTGEVDYKRVYNKTTDTHTHTNTHSFANTHTFTYTGCSNPYDWALGSADSASRPARHRAERI